MPATLEPIVLEGLNADGADIECNSTGGIAINLRPGRAAGTNSALIQFGTPLAAPALAPANTARLYFNGTDLLISVNGGAYSTVGGGSLDAAYQSGREINLTDAIGSVLLDTTARTAGTMLGINAQAASVLTGNVIAIDIDLATNVTPGAFTRTGLRVQGGFISCPDTGTDSERFGSGALATGTRGTAVGFFSSATDTNTIAAGWFSSAGASGASSYGMSASSQGTDSTAIGTNTSVLAGHTASIALGAGALTTGANQLVAGSNQAGRHLSEAYFGAGVTDATPQVSFTINTTGGSGTDISGTSLILAGGRPTGNGTGGSVRLQVAPAGLSGTTLQALTTAFEVADVAGNPGIAFFGGTPIFRPSNYTITNGAIRRAFDTTLVTLAELAEVVSTILSDLGDVSGFSLLDTNF